MASKEMTIYDVKNIEHCTVEEMGDPVFAYRIMSHEGWYIHLNDDVEDTENLYKMGVILMPGYDWSLVEIVAEADLPTDAEIASDGQKPEIA